MAFPAPHADGGEQPPTPIEPRADTGRGLRLASSDDAPPASGPRLLPTEPADAGEPAPPEPPAPPGGSRPSLKRVK
jgi:hypothetical protein